MLQSRVVALNIKQLGTWIELKFICSKELEIILQENSCTSKPTRCNLVITVNCAWINIIWFKTTKDYLDFSRAAIILVQSFTISEMFFKHPTFHGPTIKYSVQ
jgi:hypothetical protein